MRFEKRESLRKRFFLLAASFLAEGAEDFFDVFFHPYDFGGYYKYERHRAANIAYRLRKIGEIEKVINKENEVCFRFTDKGKKRLIEEIPLLRFRQKPWDGKWREVIFDIPERMKTKRELLRRKLLSLGFGMLQRSVYITPFDISKQISNYLEEQGLEVYTVVFEMERLSGASEKELARFVWKLESLHWRYLNFIRKWEKLLTIPEKEFLKNFSNFTEEYSSLLLNDPGLPKELLPDDWLSFKSHQLFRKLVSRFQKVGFKISNK